MFAVVGDTLYVSLTYLNDKIIRSSPFECIPAERVGEYILFRNFSNEQKITVGFNWAMFGLAGAAASYD